jgi:predicted alpha/beta-fold hydrolase
MKKIPLVLVAGFLGSGKTTFLQALMRELKEKGVGFSVVVNDFEKRGGGRGAAAGPRRGGAGDQWVLRVLQFFE